MAYTAAVITVSDKGAQGQRVDTSGPAVSAMLEKEGYELVYTAIIPDDFEKIKSEFILCADEKKIDLIISTGGTGFSPRDITPEATLAVIERRTPGIPEAMRYESLKITNKACLSRSEAGIRGKSLIVNLPGSEKAARENLAAVLPALDHGLEMLLGCGSANCGEHRHEHKKQAPSMDEWLKQAKAEPDSDKVGMYLFHKGIVRKSSKAKVRLGDENACDVQGMELKCDEAKLREVLAEAKKLDGISYVRVWINEGLLSVGDDIMLALVGGDIRPRVVDCLQYLVERVKNECLCERELF